MTRKIKQVNEWKLIFEDLHGAFSAVNQNTGFQSLWKKGTDALEELETIEQMDDYQFLKYCEIIKKTFVQL